nr:YHS domain-containing protein [Candidatus Tectomicrobia bacterium]
MEKLQRPTPALQENATHTDTIDPVCGMTVDPEHAAGTSEYHGRRYFFCSTSCLERFQAEPERFTGRPSGSASPQGGAQTPPPSEAAEYTCPMHPEVRQRGPGLCP